MDLQRHGFDPGVGCYGNFPLADELGGDPSELVDTRSIGFLWRDLDTIRTWSSLPLVLKGILAPEDARLAIEHGAAGVWVSNHGGRQLDRVLSGAEALAPIVDAVEGRAEVYVDGGIRWGTDVLIALGLGARAVFTARPFLYALACAGEAGVAHGLAIMRDELERGLALLVCVPRRGDTRTGPGAALATALAKTPRRRTDGASGCREASRQGLTLTVWFEVGAVFARSNVAWVFPLNFGPYMLRIPE